VLAWSRLAVDLSDSPREALMSYVVDAGWT
jgi:hypothetical protein